MVDGFFISSLLFSFFFKLYPEIIEDGRLYKAIPPLYRVDDNKDPFVVNKSDYVNRYVKLASKAYKLGYQHKNDPIQYLNKDQWIQFLTETAKYVDNIISLVSHYKVNDRLIEMILEEFAKLNYDRSKIKVNASIIIPDMIKAIDIQKLVDRICIEFPEIYYDDKDNLIRGVIDGKYQSIEINDIFIKKSIDIINIIKDWAPKKDQKLILKDIKTCTESSLSLLGVLKILRQYQPKISHRFKGQTNLGLNF